MTGYRYMFDRGADRGDLIDSHIEEISRVLEYGDVTGEDFEWKLLSAPSQPNNDVFYTAGRICCEDPTDGVKLNYDSLMLEPCRSLGGGVRVKLSVQQLLEDGTGFAVFPGQIVGVEASNPSGRLLLVKRIFLPPKQRVPDSSVQRILRLYSTPAEPEGRPVNIIIAAGPFTLSSNLLYEPLRELVKVVQKEGPDVVILMGPFVDKGHPGVGPTPNGVRAGNAEQILRNILKPIFEEILAARDGLKLVLIPSTRSRESEWVAYPQPPIGSGLDDADQRRRRAQFGLDHFGPNGAANSRVYLLPNPVQLAVNEVVVTLSNADTLMHIGSEECWRNQRPANADAASLGTGPGVAGAGSAAGSQTTTMDRMSRLFSHVLTQRHLYPLSPPSLGAPDAPFCLDFARAYGGTKPAALRAHPDVLVVPSGLRQSAKTVDGCVCLNPGQLVRGANDAAGTFARLCVHPLEMALLRRELEDARAAARGVANPRKRKARDAAGGGGGAGGMEVDG
ncbi:DNA polymerase alpha/epsilon subunit B-domain-containing protein, partial [Zopfochytrium polystomum]